MFTRFASKMTPPIAILGGGPSGLTLGRLLEVANIPYTIFDKAESTDDPRATQGGTLDLHEKSGQLALEKAGLLNQFKSIARYDATVTIADANGKVYISPDNIRPDDIRPDDNRPHDIIPDEDEGPTDKPEIDRKDLRAMLLKSLPAGKIRWGCKVHNVHRDANGLMSVELANGQTESGFRLIVGADGAWSKTRKLVTAATPEYSGLHFFATTIKRENAYHPAAATLAGKGMYMALGDNKQLLVVKLGDGSYQIGLGLHLGSSWSSENAALVKDPSALRRWLIEEPFSAWPKAHTDMIEHSDEYMFDWPLYAMPTNALSWKSVPGVTLIGDAAHLTTPLIGEGVNCAMHDSLQLAERIIKHGVDNLDMAVSEYEAEMLPRGVDLIQRSAETGKFLFAPDAPHGWLKAFAGMDTSEM